MACLRDQLVRYLRPGRWRGDSDNDEREYLAAVVDGVEAVEGVGCKDIGGKEHSGRKYGKNTRGDLNPPRGADHQHVGRAMNTGDDRHIEENPTEYEHWGALRLLRVLSRVRVLM